MLPWIIEEAVKKALATPHPGNLLATMSSDAADKYGRFLKKDEVEMIFEYASGEEHGYEIVKFWFQGKRMVTSISFNDDPVKDRKFRCLWPRMQRSPRTNWTQHHRLGRVMRQSSHPEPQRSQQE
eukprot:3118749-Amphidinium_carterae.2